MLDAVRPGLRSLDRAAGDASPLLDSLRSAAPQLATATITLPAFVRAGRPALRALSLVTHDNRAVLTRARPTASRLERATQQLGPLAGQVDDFLVSLRQTGGIEGTMRLLYTLATISGSYDDTSHFLNFVANMAPGCLHAEQRGDDAPGCSHKWSAPGYGTVPINEPSCGPQKPEDLWGNHRCPIAPPVGADVRRDAPQRKHTPTHLSVPKPAVSAPNVPGRRPSAPNVDLPGLIKKLVGSTAPPPAPASNDVEALLDFLLGP
jgi:hypothetical protein